MGHGSLSAGLCSPPFPNDQRLDWSYFHYGVEKADSVSGALQVRADDVGLGVGSQVLQEIAGVEIDAVAKANSLAVVDTAGYTSRRQFASDAATLGDKAHGTAFTKSPHEEWDSPFRAIDTYAIRTDDANASLACFIEHLLLQIVSLLHIHLAESSSEELDSFDAFDCAIIEELQHGLSGNGYDSIVYVSRDQANVREDLEFENSAAPGANRVNRSRETGGDQCMDPQRAGFYRASGCADDGNGLGIEDRLKFLKLFLKQSRSSGSPTCPVEFLVSFSSLQ